MAIVLDGELYSAPVINEPIMGGSGRISGSFDQKEAFELANVLENPLRAPLHIDESREVNPTLGKDSIRSGIKACIYGTLAVSAFMLVYYLMAGMVANVALIANIIILLGVMCSVGTTLTLPGIAGIVLTVGMAVDANVLIYERIREETAKGKSLRGAIAAGYDRAFGTIFDSHVTTLISSIILISMGTGSIKGFGVALTIGVTASLFTALIVTRMIFDFLVDRGWLKSLPMFHVIRATKLDFMKLAKPAFAISWLLIAIGVGYGFHRGKSAFGVDFLGGDTCLFSFENRADEAQVRSALTKAGIKDPLIQYQKDLSGHRHRRRGCQRPDQAAGGEVHQAEAGSHWRHGRPGNPEVGRYRRPAIPVRDPGVCGCSLRVLVCGGRGPGGGSRRAHDHWLVLPVRPRIQRDHRGGDPDHHRLLHQRHHRYLRPYPRGSEAGRPGHVP